MRKVSFEFCDYEKEPLDLFLAKLKEYGGRVLSTRNPVNASRTVYDVEICSLSLLDGSNKHLNSDFSWYIYRK